MLEPIPTPTVAALDAAVSSLARAVWLHAMDRARGALATRGYLIYWPSTTETPGAIGWIGDDEALPAGAEYATPGSLSAGMNVEAAIRGQFHTDTRRLPILSPC